MEILINEMTLSHLLQIKDILSIEFDNFWTYTIFENELKNPNSKYTRKILNCLYKVSPSKFLSNFKKA